MTKKSTRLLSRLYMALIMFFLYAPILVLIIFSFNSGKTQTKWQGFTLKWYEELFKDKELMPALSLSLEIAVLAAIISTIIGVLAAIGLYKMNARLRSSILAVNNIPIVNPEIVTGVSMLLLFLAMSSVIGNNILGYGTLLIAHITFCIPYVVLSILPKLRQLNPNTVEAAQDLGCPPVKAYFKVVIPEIMPGIITGAMIAFTLSLDDFVISLFNKGNTMGTLAVVIYNKTKKPIKPSVNALSALLFVAVITLLVIINVIQIRSQKRNEQKR